jgi:hypothetical protein
LINILHIIPRFKCLYNKDNKEIKNYKLVKSSQGRNNKIVGIKDNLKLQNLIEEKLILQ